MTTEELLKPRYKVVAKYPESRFEVDEILTQWIGSNFAGKNPYIIISNPQEYPAIFKRLSWWEGLSINELPKYLKVREDAIRKVIKWDLPNGKVYVTNGFSEKPRYNNISIYVPATEEEYLQFTNHKEVIK